MKIDDFVAYVRNRGYPRSLTDGQIRQSYHDAATEMQLWTPQLRYGYFETIDGQDVYDVFGRNGLSQPELIDAMGYSVVKLVWSVSPNPTNDPFLQGPFLGPYNGTPILPFSSSNMWRPSDAIIYAADLDSVQQNFFDADWEPVDSDPASPVRLLPTPSGDGGRAWVRYVAHRDPGLLYDLSPAAYSKFAEARVCEVMSIREMETAGKEFALFKDRGAVVKLWSDKSLKFMQDAAALLERVGVGTVCPATRD